LGAESKSEVVFTLFSKFQPFSAILAKVAVFLDGFENGALSMVGAPYNSFAMLNPSLKSVLQYFQTFRNFQPFLGNWPNFRMF
jgi:hypothetical protein